MYKHDNCLPFKFRLSMWEPRACVSFPAVLWGAPEALTSPHVSHTGGCWVSRQGFAPPFHTNSSKSLQPES